MVNWDRISELRDEVGEDDLAEVLELFCEEVEDVLELLPNAPPSAMPGHLHFLKGSALNIGLDDVSRLCRDEEVRLADNPEAQTNVQAIRSAYQAARGDLQPLLQ